MAKLSICSPLIFSEHFLLIDLLDYVQILVSKFGNFSAYFLQIEFLDYFRLVCLSFKIHDLISKNNIFCPKKKKNSDE